MEHEPESFGIWKINIVDAAKLVAIDLCINGYIDGKIPDEFEWDIDDLGLNKALKKQIEAMELLLCEAVAAGRLKVEKVRRNIQQEIISDANFIDLTDLQDWLSDSGYELGDFIKSYLDDEIDLSCEISEEVKIRRALKKNSVYPKENQALTYLSSEKYPIGLTVKKIEECTKEGLYEACKSLALQNNELVKEIKGLRAVGGESVDDSNVSQVKRRLNNQLKVIAAMAYDGYANSLEKPGALTGILTNVTQELECGVGKDTVRNILINASDYVPQNKRYPIKKS
jgi:hypothetical protein